MLGAVSLVVAFGAKALPIKPKYLKIIGVALLILGLGFYVF